MAAPLALTRETGGGDLLDVTPAKSTHRQDADDTQDDANPPVPNIRCKHGSMVVTEVADGLVAQELLGEQ